MGKRESKLYTNTNIVRLEREIEKTSKQLQNELFLIENSKNDQISRVYKLELNELFENVEEYFHQKNVNLKNQLNYHKANYKQVKSKINTGGSKVSKRKSKIADPNSSKEDMH